MKKFLSVISLAFACMFLCCGFTFPAEQQALSQDKSAIIIDANTGEVVYEKNSQEKLQVASIVKLMTTLLTIEDIEAGKVSLDDMLTASENAAGMGGSQVFIDAYSTYSVKDMLKSVIVASANDASVALSEYLCGSEEEFVKRMNKRAKELGLDNTIYANSTGLPMPEEYSCAKDVATLLMEVSKHQIYHDYCMIWMDELVHPSGRKTELVNTNKLVRYYKGCTGGKTGFTDEAGYCLSCCAEKGNLRFVAVSLGAKDAKARFENVTKLFNYAFANFENKHVADKSKQVCTLQVQMGKTDAQVFFAEDYFALSKKGENQTCEVITELDKNINAPLKAGSKVGKAKILKNGKLVKEIDLVIDQDIQKLGYKDTVKDIISHWYA